MTNLPEIFEKLLAKSELNEEDLSFFLSACISSELNDCQIAAVLALVRMKGETVAELSFASKFILSQAKTVNLGEDLIDIVGTGGDKANTFNISTSAAIVAAAAGAKVAKHGSRGFSSQSGSIDLLSLAGFKLFDDEQNLKASLKETNICFLYAPYFHPALAAVQTARSQLSFRTFFNYIGPLLNPAKVKRQVIGVSESKWQIILADVLVNLGSERVVAVHSRDGLDEASIADLTDVREYKNGEFNNWTLNPKAYGIDHADLSDIKISSPEESLSLILKAFSGKSCAARDAVVLNAGLALYCADIKTTIEEAIKLAAFTIDNGAALSCFKNLQKVK